MKSLIKEWAFKKWYWYVSNIDRNNEILFMNYGFSSPSQQLILDEKDEINRYSIQLYHQIINHVEVSGKDLVEIGCGRGGGLSFVHRYFKPASSIGIDLNERAMQFANRFYQLKGLQFKQGDAHQISLADQSCDVVLNVESSHRYQNPAKFLSEVQRILRPKGYFVMTDFRFTNDYPAFVNLVENSDFMVIKHQLITPEVVKALQLDDPRRRILVDKLVPKMIAKVGLNFAGAVDSPTYNRFANEEYKYFNFILQKK